MASNSACVQFTVPSASDVTGQTSGWVFQNPRLSGHLVTSVAMMILSKTPVESPQSVAKVRSFNSTDPPLTVKQPVTVVVGTVHVPQSPATVQLTGEMGTPLTTIPLSPV